MRTTASVLLLSSLCWGCDTPGLTIYASPELATAAIYVDGKLAGHFQKTQREYRWLGWKNMKEEFTNAPRSETIAKLPPVSPGRHELRVFKPGYEPVVIAFTYSPGGAEIEIDDALIKPLSRATTHAGQAQPLDTVPTTTATRTTP